MIQLSASALGIYKNCPRCFWLDRNTKIKRPRGIFPSLPGGMDRTLKTYYDGYRANGILPTELAELSGKYSLYPNQAALNRMRDWRSGLTIEGAGYRVVTAFDDLLVVVGDGNTPPIFSVLDYKTKGSAPKPGDTEGYYGHQADVYDLALEQNGHKTDHQARFIYYWPEEQTPTLATKMRTEIVPIQCDPERAKRFIAEAVACLQGPLPKAGECEYCGHHESLTLFESRKGG